MNEAVPTALAVEQAMYVDAPRERVFELLTNVSEIRRWMPMSAFEPRVGGRFEFVRGDWQAEGEVTELESPRLVVYTWDWRNQPLGVRTEVRWELEEDGEGTLVRFSHRGFHDPEQHADHGHGWTFYVSRLKTAAEGGDPGPDDLVPRR